MKRRAPEASADIRLASVENELKAGQICSAIELFVARVEPRDVMPELQRFGDDAEPARIVVRPVDSVDDQPDDFGITSTGSKAEDFGRIGLAAGAHLADKVGLPVDGRDVRGNFAAMPSE